MRVYLFYIHESFLKKEFRYTVTGGDKIFSIADKSYFFYAFTSDKQLKERFIQERIDDFVCFTREIKKSEFTEFKKSVNKFELSMMTYKNYTYDAQVLSTLNEYEHCKFGWCELFNERNILSNLPYNLLETLQYKNSEILAKLGLNSLIIIYDEELSSLITNSIEFCEECILNIEDQEYHDSLGKLATISLKIKPKEYNLYLHRFNSLYK